MCCFRFVQFINAINNGYLAEDRLVTIYQIPEAWVYAIGINLFLTGKNALILKVPILINKDVLEPSYKDLKFMV